MTDVSGRIWKALLTQNFSGGGLENITKTSVGMADVSNRELSKYKFTVSPLHQSGRCRELFGKASIRTANH